MLTCKKAGNSNEIAIGKMLIRSEKVGCIVLAGGDGSRLGWKGPKGTFPLSLIKQKTLFQILAEKIEAASLAFGCKLPIAIMTSPLNRFATQQALPDYFEIFEQEMSPLLDLKGNLLEEKRPNGNGDVLKLFYQSGIYTKWKARGIKYIQVIFIDNPLAEPYDPNQIGIHYKTGSEVSIKAIEKSDPNEKVGVIGNVEGKLQVVEYSQNPPKSWKIANTGLFCFSMDFIEKSKNLILPTYRVKKTINNTPVYKTESFLFDILFHVSKAEVILYERGKTFAPLKEPSDVEFVQKALLDRDRNIFQQLTGHFPENIVFELSASFHYPTKKIIEKWKNRPHPGSAYLEV